MGEKLVVAGTVFAGGGLGAVLRYLIGRATQGHVGFPTGTLFVNVTGCLLFGLLTGLAVGRENESGQLFVFTGLLGGYTTFSTFGHETVSLLRLAPARGALYVGLSLGLSLIAVAAGAWAGGRFRGV